jgi:membrane protease subunit HflK
MMYLPLDKLGNLGTGAGPGAVRKVTIDSSNIRELTNAVTEQLRNDAAAAGTRRGGR